MKFSPTPRVRWSVRRPLGVISLIWNTFLALWLIARFSLLWIH